MHNYMEQNMDDIKRTETIAKPLRPLTPVEPTAPCQLTIHQLLQQVYIKHHEEVKKQQINFDAKQSEYENLRKQCSRLSERARDYRNSNSTLKEQNKKLSIELEEMRNRLVAPCLNCELLRKNVEEVKKLYNMALEDKDRSIARLETGRGVLSSGSKRDDVSDELRKKGDADKSEPNIHSKTTQQSRRKTYPALSNHSSLDTSIGKEEDLLFGEEDSSPEGSLRLRNSLKLTRHSKKRYKEELKGQAEKRLKTSPIDTKASREDTDIVTFVPETCNFDTTLEMESFEKTTNDRIKSSMSKKVAPKCAYNVKEKYSKLVVPETLPTMLDEDVISLSDAEDDITNQDITCKQVKVIHETKENLVDALPVTPKKKIRHMHQTHPLSPIFGISPNNVLKRQSKTPQTSFKSPSLFDEDENCGKESAKKNKSITGLVDLIAAKRESSFIDTSRQSEPSPSLLNNNKLQMLSLGSDDSAIQRIQISSPDVTTHLKQTSLLETFRQKTKNSKHSKSTKDDDITLQEKLDLDIALKNSLKDIEVRSSKTYDCQEVTTHENEQFPITSTPAVISDGPPKLMPSLDDTFEVFKKPDYTASEHRLTKKHRKIIDPDETCQLTVPSEHSQRIPTRVGTSSAQNRSCLNGTVDPNLLLSEYESEAMDNDLTAVEVAAAQEENEEPSQSVIPSGVSVTFGKVPKRPTTVQDDLADDFTENDLDSSFDRVPKKDEPGYKYDVVIRKKSERDQLAGHNCACCEGYFDNIGLSDSQKQDRLKLCSRHKAKFTTAGTPPHFWSVGFPDTQECEERGYLNKTQHKPSTHRRRRGYKKLFKTKKEEQDSESQENSNLHDQDEI